MMPLRFTKCWLGILRRARRADVVTLHAGTTALYHWGALVLLATTLARKPLVLRKFGAGDYRELGGLRAIASGIVVRGAKLFLVETRRLEQLCGARINVKVRWFPTTREFESSTAPDLSVGERRCRSFVYVGHVREFKGIRELVEAAENMPKDVEVNVYGPMFADISRDLFKGRSRIFYKGVLQPHEVLATLRRYDAAILPTKASSEGYPGAIIEAFASGLPVISTRCGAIPELVDDTVGILIDPADSAQLEQAMRSLYVDVSLFTRLRGAVRERARGLSTGRWAGRFISYCVEATR